MEYKNEIPVTYTEKYFHGVEKAPLLIQRIAQKIRTDNDKFHFIEKIAKFGMPVWDKSPMVPIKKAAASSFSQNNLISVDDTLVFVPLVLDTKNMVSSFLACAVGRDSVTIRLIRGDLYTVFPMSFPGYTEFTAETMVTTCMILDNLVFGHEVFRINDLELFLTSNGRTENENRFLTLAAKNDLGGNTSNIFNQPVPITTCYDITVEGDQGQLSSGIPPGGRADYSYSDVICFTSYLWIEFIANNPVITLPSTGTGGGSWWQDEHNGCTSLPNGCGQPAQGWQPFAEGFDFMENYYQLGYQHFEFAGVSPIDEQQIEKWTAYHLNENGLDTCRKQILDKLLSTSGNIPIGKILTKLARAISAPNNLEKMDIRFNIKPNLGAVAQTDSFLYNTTTKVFSCAISLDSAAVSKATDIFIAGTFLHEAIHAYMTDLLIRRRMVPLQLITSQ